MQNINNKLQIVNTVEVVDTYTLKEIKDRISILKEQRDVINAELDKFQDLKQQALNLGVYEPVEETIELTEAVVEPVLEAITSEEVV